jgi:hypothetical protein
MGIPTGTSATPANGASPAARRSDTLARHRVKRGTDVLPGTNQGPSGCRRDASRAQVCRVWVLLHGVCNRFECAGSG